MASKNYTEELKPCPFCHSEDVRFHNGWARGSRKDDISNHRTPSITCRDCGIGFSSGSFGRGISDKSAKKETFQQWNKRPSELKDFSIPDLLEEIASRLHAQEIEGIEHWCDECDHFITGAGNKNPCSMDHKMKFHTPEDYGELQHFGFYKLICTDRSIKDA